MKISRFIKLRTFGGTSTDLALEQNHNPLKHKVSIETPTADFTTQWLLDFRGPLDGEKAAQQPFVNHVPSQLIRSHLRPAGYFVRRHRSDG